MENDKKKDKKNIDNVPAMLFVSFLMIVIIIFMMLKLS